uniref:Uncharacterized protein n=1 Tax=Rhizophora mucronata TaxID=61149 RepID=A0A2P2J4R1_RHIMU
MMYVYVITRKTSEQVAPKYGYTETKQQMSQRAMLQSHMRILMLPKLLLSGLTTRIFMVVLLEFL